MNFTRLVFLALALAAAPLRAELTPQQIKSLSGAEIEKLLPKEHPAAYYAYATRLFSEGRKDDAVFWLYVGQLRYRFHIKANPKLDPSGDPALFGSLSSTVGERINQYAGGNVKDWVKAIDRALQWDGDTANDFTSKKTFAKAYEENRAALKAMRDGLLGQVEFIREQRKKAGMENRD